MEKDTRLIAVSQLVGLPVSSSQSKEEVGKVSDLVVAPLRGVAIGITIKMNYGSAFTIPQKNILLEGDSVFICGELAELEIHPPIPSTVSTSGELLGASIVTEKGKLIGHVRDVFFQINSMNILYKVSVPGWRRALGVFRKEYFLAGDLPYAYSRIRNRLIVPFDAVMLPSLDSIIKKQNPREDNFIPIGQSDKIIPLENRQHGF